MRGKEIILVIILLSNSFFGISQANQKALDTSHIENAVSKNIFIFRILRSEEFIKSGLDNEGYLKSAHTTFFNYLPDRNCKLDLKLKVHPIAFPDTSFITLEVVKGLGLYLCGNTRFDEELHPFNDLGNRMLIAVHRRSGQILFVSGEFFLNDIRHFFKFEDIVADLTLFLRFKLFMYGVDLVRYQRKQGNFYIFQGVTSSGDLLRIKVLYKKGVICRTMVDFS